MNHLLQNKNYSSGITPKILSFLNSLFKNTFNSAKLINKFLKKFPVLMKNILLKYNHIKLDLVKRPNNLNLKINQQFHRIKYKTIRNDIEGIISTLNDFISQNHSLNNQISSLYTKRFITEMECLKALVYFTLIYK